MSEVQASQPSKTPRLTPQEWKLIDRMKEPSSWAAIAAGFASFGITLPGQWVHAVSLAGAGIACLLGILLREKGA